MNIKLNIIIIIVIIYQQKQFQISPVVSSPRAHQLILQFPIIYAQPN